MEKKIKFEGAEKKLEIILNSPIENLRDNINNRWDKVIKACNALILSKIENHEITAYLLSESSLFVWKDKVLIITCGKTDLTKSIEEILSFIDKNKIGQVFYERKNFLFPLEQPKNFSDDTIEIEKNFKGIPFQLGPTRDNHIHLFHSDHTYIKMKKDVTLQILMHDLPPSVMKLFTGNNREKVLTESGLDQIYPETIVDSHLFHPTGFSMNGIDNEFYYTFHITPQSDCSYTSFETNIQERDYTKIINSIISIFRPKNFSIVLTKSINNSYDKIYIPEIIENYKTAGTDKQTLDCGYEIIFINKTQE